MQSYGRVFHAITTCSEFDQSDDKQIKWAFSLLRYAFPILQSFICIHKRSSLKKYIPRCTSGILFFFWLVTCLFIHFESAVKFMTDELLLFFYIMVVFIVEDIQS